MKIELFFAGGKQIKVCRRCGEVGGDKTGFGPWCEKGHRAHDRVFVTVKVARPEGESDR